MGESVSWIAFRGIDRAEIAARLECADTDAAADHRTELALGRTANGWPIVRSRRFDYPTPSRLSVLSRDAELIACQIEEHVMVSAAYAFQRGQQVWAIRHDPGKGVYDLEIEGTPPAEFETIRSRLKAEQDAEGGEDADVDTLFDVAQELLAAVSGFRREEDDLVSFTQLRPFRRGLLQTLFGKR